ncbi:hypothetical protein FQR65_LT15345 [Abscondita terminalis]|nr:hypothetical protein FQR65_LT15345 [Abscondita terminalis]
MGFDKVMLTAITVTMDYTLKIFGYFDEMTGKYTEPLGEFDTDEYKTASKQLLIDLSSHYEDSNQRIADALEPINEVKTEDIKVSINTKIDEKVIMKNNINIKVIGKDLGEYEVNDFSVGASPFVYSDIFKYSKRDQNDNVELNSIIDFLSDEHKSYLTPKLKSLLEHDRYKNARPFDDVSSTSPKKPLDNAFLDGTHTGDKMIKVTLLNDKTIEFDKPVKIIDVAKKIAISLGKDCAGALINDEIVLSNDSIISENVKLEIITSKHILFEKIVNNTGAQILSCAINKIYKNSKFNKVRFNEDGSFGVLFDTGLPLKSEEMQEIERVANELISKKMDFIPQENIK